MSKNYHLFDLIWFAICNFLFLITTTCQNEIRRVGERDLYRVTLNLGEWYPRCSHPRLQGRSERAQNKISPKNLKTSITFHSHPTQCCMHKNQGRGRLGSLPLFQEPVTHFYTRKPPSPGDGGWCKKNWSQRKRKATFFFWDLHFFSLAPPLFSLWHIFFSGTLGDFTDFLLPPPRERGFQSITLKNPSYQTPPLPQSVGDKPSNTRRDATWTQNTHTTTKKNTKKTQ